MDGGDGSGVVHNGDGRNGQGGDGENEDDKDRMGMVR